MSLKKKTKKLFLILYYLVRHPVRFFRALGEEWKLNFHDGSLASKLKKALHWCWATRRRKVFVSALVLALILGLGTWKYLTRPLPSLTDDLKKFSAAGEQVKSDFDTLPKVALAQTKDGFQVTDDIAHDGLQVQYNDPSITKNTPDQPDTKKEMQINFPKDYSKPLEVKLDDQRSILITDNSKDKFSSQILVDQGSTLAAAKVEPLSHEAAAKVEPLDNYLKYSSGRKSIYYAYQKDQAQGERQLKNWLIYQKGSGNESEAYTFQNARLELDQQGQVNVFFDDGKQEKNQQAMADVEPSLMERARQAIMKDTGQDITKQQNQKPDFTIPQAYYIGKDGTRKTVDWKIEDGKTLKLDFSVPTSDYPIALDPTLQFTAPGTSNSVSVITGESANNSFGYSLAAGDFNADGKTDLVVGAYYYSSLKGRVYIFYNKSAISTAAGTADAIITGESGTSRFGASLAAGDFNADGKTDLAVGAYRYSSYTGRVYLFYQSNFPASAASADAKIDGENTGDQFGVSLTTGDFNADGKIDLAVGAYGYPSYSNQGRVYIFYQNNFPASAASADAKITGENTGDQFGSSLTTGDFNADGKTDLAVGAIAYSSSKGRVYIFYQNNFPASAASASAIITGENNNDQFGYSLAAGDLNNDGKIDLAVGANRYSSFTGRVYIFYQNNFPASAASADKIITGENTNDSFGLLLATGDLNADGKTDLAVGANYYSSGKGRVYIFYNVTFPASAASASAIITGESGSYFGDSLATGDFNADGKTDLVVGASDYSSSKGRAYIFYSQNGLLNSQPATLGENSSDNFGSSLATGDFNNDGKTDLAVGAVGYSSSKGRVYIFYQSNFPASAASADAKIDGENNSDQFGYRLAAGDLNADGKTDLIVEASYSSAKGRVYIFYQNNFPASAASASAIITGEYNGDLLGLSLATGDFNADGKTDLAAGAYRYSSLKGRVYIFYQANFPASAASADAIITGESNSNYFGASLAAGDFNADGKTDLAVGAYHYSSYAGRVYIFYQGNFPASAASADAKITGENNSDYFSATLAAGDFNADGKTDLAVGADGYSSSKGRTYIFYQNNFPSSAASADAIITGENNSDYLGLSLATGDLNADGKTDLVVDADGYSSGKGRVYIFSNGNFPTSAASADISITGENNNDYFGQSLATGDLNADGKTDLAVGATHYSSSKGTVYYYTSLDNYSWTLQRQPDTTRIQGATGDELKITGVPDSRFGSAMATGDFNGDGRMDLAVGAPGYNGDQGRVYIFWNDGSIPTSAYSPDVVITGENIGSCFGYSLATGDLNADGKTDLAVGAYGYSTDKGRVYLFYQGNYPASASSADKIITGENDYDHFGISLTTGDLNADGKTDLAVGAPEYFMGSSNDHVYIFYQSNFPTSAASASAIITGENMFDNFGVSLAAGDFNNDGKTDLAVGASNYSTKKGRVYLFYQNNFPASAASASAIITGEATNNYFGYYSLAAGDFNNDGKTDLAVGAYGYSTDKGRVYLFYQSNFPASASAASAIITGENTGDYFGLSLATGDLNADGKTDLAVCAFGYPSYSGKGRVYIFYQNNFPASAVSADAKITGENNSDYLGVSLVTGDLNADGKTDLIVGAYGYSSYQGRVYIYTMNDTISSGETGSGSQLGSSMVAGDFNNDGKMDLAVGAYGYSSGKGRVYIFYNNNGSIKTTAASADKIITGENDYDFFGTSLAAGDLNADGKTDLAVGAYRYSSLKGRVYIFYQSNFPASAASASAIITGENDYDRFGWSLATGDLNADGKTDLAVGAYYYSSWKGRVYLFYQANFPASAASASAIITGENNYDRFGWSLATGDLNADGKTDLAVGAYGYPSDDSKGRVYIFYQSNFPASAASADAKITGENNSDQFGISLATGDLNADGKTDLAVGAWCYPSNSMQGRAYIFYQGNFPASAASASAIITGENNGDSFGYSLATGDLNADGKTDLVVGAYYYPSYSAKGRAYLFYESNFPASAASASAIITGENNSDSFGYSLATGDLNADGKTDLAIGANGANSGDGKFYVIISEASTATQTELDQMHTKLKASGNVQFQGNVNVQ